MTPSVAAGLYQVFARWDGRLYPPPAGDAISVSARVVHVPHAAESFHCVAGLQAAVAVVRHRSGKELDPTLARFFADNAQELLAPTAALSVWDQALKAEPEPRRCVPGVSSRGDRCRHRRILPI